MAPSITPSRSPCRRLARRMNSRGLSGVSIGLYSWPATRLHVGARAPVRIASTGQHSTTTEVLQLHSSLNRYGVDRRIGAGDDPIPGSGELCAQLSCEVTRPHARRDPVRSSASCTARARPALRLSRDAVRAPALTAPLPLCSFHVDDGRPLSRDEPVQQPPRRVMASHLLRRAYLSRLPRARIRAAPRRLLRSPPKSCVRAASD